MRTFFMLAMILAISAVGCTAKDQPVQEVEKTPAAADTIITADSAYEQGTWITNYNDALTFATELKRPILINFTGSDWCPWCFKIRDEVFIQDEFKAYAKDNLVLLTIDFPSKKKLPPAEVKQNNALQKQYGIEGYPTILLIDSEGKEINRTGYQPGGAAAYVKHIQELLSE